MTQRLDIAVAGCGVAGLAVGTLLARAGHRVTAFDRLAAPAPVGSGLILQPAGLAVLDTLGVLGRILALGQRIDRLYGRVVPSGRIVLDVRYGALKEPGFGVAIHRAALFHVLYEAALEAGVVCEPSREITGVEALSGSRAALALKGGARTPAFDLVVDALGARSALSPKPGEFLPFGALWANIPWPDNSPFSANALEQRYQRASKMIGVLPIGQLPDKAQKLAAFFWSLKGADEAAWRATPLDAWKAEVAAIWPETAPLLGPLAREDLVFARYAHRTLRAPVSAGLVHVGDSYHAASPQLGQGANMALLDALALATAVERFPLAEAPAAYCELSPMAC